MSAARAIGLSSRLRDPLAHTLGRSEFVRRFEVFAANTRPLNLVRLALRAVSLGLIDHNTVRMLLIDEHIRRWTQSGVDQLVILGAGLDTRAWRMPELSSARVYEVDHPDTQGEKKRRVAAAKLSARSVQFVAVDFEGGNLLEALAGGGFDASRPAIWVCEGVTAYLPRHIIERLVSAVGEASAPGSHLAMSYVTPHREEGRLSKGVVGFLVARAGEHARGKMSSEDVRELLESARLTPMKDMGWKEWLESLPARSRVPNLLQERLLLARK